MSVPESVTVHGPVVFRTKLRHCDTSGSSKSPVWQPHALLTIQTYPILQAAAMFKIPALHDSPGLTLHNDPPSDLDPSESGWETISNSNSSTKLDLTDMPGWEYSPEVDNTRDYTDDERLDLALKSYYLKLEAYETGKVGDFLPPSRLRDKSIR